MVIRRRVIGIIGFGFLLKKIREETFAMLLRVRRRGVTTRLSCGCVVGQRASSFLDLSTRVVVPTRSASARTGDGVRTVAPRMIELYRKVSGRGGKCCIVR